MNFFDLKRVLTFTGAVFLMLLFFILSAQILAFAEDLSDYEAVAENEYLILHMNYETTEFAVVEKQSGEIWFSTPQGDPRMREIFRIRSYDPEGHRFRMNNYEDSVEIGQFEIEPLENGVRVEYLLGEMWEGGDYLPRMIAKDRLENLIIDKIASDFDRRLFYDNYTLISLEKMDDDYERVNVHGLNKDRLFGEYTLVVPGEEISDTEKRNLYNTLIGRMTGRRGEFEHSGVDMIWTEVRSRDHLIPDMFDHLKENPTYLFNSGVIEFDEDDMVEIILEETDYQPQDTIEDHMANNIDPPRETAVTFFVPIEYYLEKDTLVVRIPTEELSYPQDIIPVRRDYGAPGTPSQASLSDYGGFVESFGMSRPGERTVTFPLSAIKLLRFFGTPEPGEEGYLFIPDGSGAIIEANTGGGRTFARTTYGRDLAFPAETRSLKAQENRLPVYGIQKGQQAFLAIIEDGDAMSQIRVEIPRRPENYDSIFAEFNIIPQGEVALPAGPDGDPGLSMNIYQERMFEGDIQLRYAFMSGDDANYVGMANRYRTYLEEKFNMAEREHENIPLILEVLGGVPVVRPILGFPREVIEPLTTYTEAQIMVEELLSGGVENLNLRYSGWFEGGLHHFFPSRVNLERQLGSRENFNELLATLAEYQVGFYPDLDFMQVYKTHMRDGFRPRQDSIFSLDRRLVRMYDYDLATYHFQPERARYLLSPREYSTIVGGLLNSLDQFQLSGLSLRSVGEYLYSDFIEGHLVDRQQSKGIVTGELARISKDAGINLMMDGGNAYVLPYVDALVNMPLDDSDYTIVEREVPFYQIAVGGFVDFAGEPINLADNYRHNLLKTLETGAVPYFSLGYRDPSFVKGTDFNHFYSVDYTHWKDRVLEVYDEFNSIYKKLEGTRISAHHMLEEDVFMTVYENGTSIIVNYTIEPFTIGDLVVEAEDYLVVDLKKIEF